MSDRLKSLLSWVDDRSGIPGLISKFLNKPLPPSVGWFQTLGSILLFLFGIQLMTGLMLAINYSPSPAGAYNSLWYIINDVSHGWFIHNLHHWAASLMVVFIVLHMIRVFIWGAYKAPRELLWISGMALFLLVLAFGFTGYLLPWDQKAYWATVVGIKVIETIPGLGPIQAKILMGGDALGIATLPRFFTIHAILLPLVSLILIGVHLFILQRVGSTPKSGKEPKSVPFFPSQAGRDLMAVSLIFALLMAWSFFVAAPLELKADPADTTYNPRPEWYFYSLFQLLHFFEGDFELLGTMVIPGLVVLFLIFLPFLDRSPETALSQRKPFAIIGSFLLLAMILLTYQGAVQKPVVDSTGTALSSSRRGILPIELAGKAYMEKYNCFQCHELGSRKQVGDNYFSPDLFHLNPNRDGAFITAHIKDPQITMPGAKMPSFWLSESKTNAIAAYLLRLRDEKSDLNFSPEVVSGATHFYQEKCSKCHAINGVGDSHGPDLTHVGSQPEKDRQWHTEHLQDPQSKAPKSDMPPTLLEGESLDNLVSYLLSLK